MKHVSASQVRLFQECQRKWYFRYVDRIATPTTPAQELGTKIHAGIEHYLHTGVVADDEVKRFVIAVLPFLPLPGDELLIEHRFTMPTFDGGPEWLGYIDLAYEDDFPVVCDHKTTSNFRYAKTPNEMQDDTQVCSYAKWLQDRQEQLVGAATDVQGRLLYIHTRRKKVQVKPVDTVLTRDRVLAVWARDLEVVQQMVVAERANEANALLPNTATCGKYGGCAYRKQCGLEIITNPGRKKAVDMGNFLDRIKAKQAEQSEESAAPEASSNEDSNGGGNGQTGPTVVSADAAPRTTPVEETKPEESAPETPKKRGRKPLTEAEKKARKAQRMAAKLKEKAEAAAAQAEAAAAEAAAAEAAKAAESPVAAATTPQTNGEGFTIYVDCYPVKGNGATVMFDDWVIPIIADINNEIEVADYRLLGFAQEKLALQAGLEKHLDSVPPVLIITSANNVAKDALQTLIPHAKQVIRAIR